MSNKQANERTETKGPEVPPLRDGIVCRVYLTYITAHTYNRTIPVLNRRN
jgi:hypothetical protein